MVVKWPNVKFVYFSSSQTLIGLQFCQTKLLTTHFFSSCVPNPNCNGKVETDSKMKSDCFNTNNPTDEKICCNENDVIEVPPPCSEMPEYR